MVGFSGIGTSWSMRLGRSRNEPEQAAAARVATAGPGRVEEAAAEVGVAR